MYSIFIIGLLVVFGPAAAIAFIPPWLDALKSPQLKGVPLPKVDDKRWEHKGDYYELGSFSVWAPRGAVYFHGQRLGVWSRYARAIRKNYGKPDYNGLAKRAREELS